MSNYLYDLARQSFLSQNPSIDWDTDTIKVVLVHESAGGTPYTPNSATDQFLAIIPSGARIATSAALTAPTVTAGVADAADITLTAVTGVQVDSIVIYKDTGVPATSPLIARIDTGYTGLPFVPSGSDVTIQWPSTSNRIFKL